MKLPTLALFAVALLAGCSGSEKSSAPASSGTNSHGPSDSSEAASTPTTGGTSTPPPPPAATPGPTGPAPFICDNRAIESRCFDYWQGASQSDVDGTCDGKVVNGPCSKTSAIGTCAVSTQHPPFTGKQITAVYYSDGEKPWTTTTAQADCDSLGGSFAPP
jgi:hypothetical protein